MHVETDVADRSQQVPIFSIGQMLALVVSEPFGEAEVNDVEIGVFFVSAHHEVFGLDVSVDVAFGVQVVELGDLLVDDHKHTFQRKRAIALV